MKSIKIAIKYFIEKNWYKYFLKIFMPFELSIWEDMNRLGIGY